MREQRSACPSPSPPPAPGALRLAPVRSLLRGPLHQLAHRLLAQAVRALAGPIETVTLTSRRQYILAVIEHATRRIRILVDQPASIGALPIAVARDMGCQVAYLPGLTMRRIADLYPGEAKTDARDAFVIADAARSMPHTLRSIELTDETVAELEMIVGFDDDLAGEATRISNRLPGLLTQIHPHLERVLGPRIQHPAVLKLLDQFGSPA